MRTYGRIANPDGSLKWVEVTTDANGFDDSVYMTTLCQTLNLGLGESPFFGSYGIPAQQSVVTQVFPDFYVAQTQQQFAPFFASLTVERVQGASSPRYKASAIFQPGSILPEPGMVAQ